MYIVSLCRALGVSIDAIEGIGTPDKPVQPVDHPTLLYLREALSEKNKWIRVLFFCCAALMAVIVFLLVFDITNPNIGYVRY